MEDTDGPERFTRLQQHCRALFSSSIPIIFTSLIVEITFFVTILFIGRLKDEHGPIYIGAATLGNMLCAVTGYSITSGMCTALDSLVSQAYGAKNYRMMGTYCQRAIAILTLGSIVIVGIWFQTEFILETLLRLHHDIAAWAGLWVKLMAIGLWPGIISEILGKFLTCQQIIWPVLVCSGLGAVSNAVATYLLVNVWGRGFVGCALGYVISKWCYMAALIGIMVTRRRCLANRKSHVYHQVQSDEDSAMDDSSLHTDSATTTTTSTSSQPDKESTVVDGLEDVALESQWAAPDPEDNWPTPSWDVFLDWEPFLRLGIPGALSLSIEWGSFELAAGIVGQLGTVPLAAHAILANTANLTYMIPASVSYATATLVGNLLGGGCHREARDVVWVGMVSVFIVGAVWALVMLALGGAWCAVYTSDPAVLDMLHRVLPVFALYLFTDSFKCASMNILRSTGRPSTTVWGNGIACLLLMLPLGYLLTIVAEMGLWGEWVAMTLAWAVVGTGFLVVIVRTDWKEQSELAIRRSGMISLRKQESVSTEMPPVSSVASSAHSTDPI